MQQNLKYLHLLESVINSVNVHIKNKTEKVGHVGSTTLDTPAKRSAHEPQQIF